MDLIKIMKLRQFFCNFDEVRGKIGNFCGNLQKNCLKFMILMR